MQNKVKEIFTTFGLKISEMEKTASEEPLEKRASDCLTKLNEAIDQLDLNKVASGISTEENIILNIVKDFQNL
jgi:hypothetical protein